MRETGTDCKQSSSFSMGNQEVPEVTKLKVQIKQVASVAYGIKTTFPTHTEIEAREAGQTPKSGL